MDVEKAKKPDLFSPPHEEALLTFARTANAIIQCPSCNKHDVRLMSSELEGKYQDLVMEAFLRGDFKHARQEQIRSEMRIVLSRVRRRCPESVTYGYDDDEFDELYGPENIRTGDLDTVAANIYFNIDKIKLPKIKQMMDQHWRQHFADDTFLEVRQLFDEITDDYQEAYRGEVAARRSSPVWHSEQRNAERESLDFASAQISALRFQLEAATSPQREWERHQNDYRSLMASREALSKIVSRSNFSSTLFVYGIFFYLCSAALAAWVWLLQGDVTLYLTSPLRVVALATIILGIPILYAIYKDMRAAVAEEKRYRPWLERPNGVDEPQTAPSVSQPRSTENDTGAEG